MELNLQSQHPVVEELLTNKYFGDTLLVCANGHLTDNKLAVGLLFPCLLTSDIFALPIENVLLVPDYTMEEIGREFEKLIIGGNCKVVQPEIETVEQIDLVDIVDEEEDATKDEPTLEVYGELSNDSNDVQTVVSFSPSEIEEAELVIDESPTERPDNDNAEVDIENGYDENYHNIEIGESTSDSIQIFVAEEAPLDEETGPPDDVAQADYYLEQTDDIHAAQNGNPDDLQLELFTNNDNVNIVDENNANTDGGIIPVMKPEKSKKFKTVTFKEDLEEHMTRNSRPKRWRQTKLKLKVEEGCQEVIENLPTLPDVIESSGSPEKSPRRSPKKDSPIFENRKPGRPRTRPDQPNLRARLTENGLTRYKVKSAEWKATELFKCGVCAKVLSCKGSFERHSRMHQDAKPYKCSFCPKTFREACKKSVHERVHSGSKPYPCQQCNKSFRTATQRIVHQRSHLKEKQYSCEVCGKAFSQPYSVKVHMQRFHK